ncbi:MAG: FHA domain-containing protein [Candidatus Azobacteroides sp.]|nr:FHA domain-containing protein [Candidatus Azobacteroides sp.]
MKYFLINVLCLFSFFGYAQQGTLKGDVNTKNFPEVSFIWNEYNPIVLDSTSFLLKDSGTEVKFFCKPIPKDSIPQKNKSILFLWEDQPIRKDQFDFSQQLLYYFFDKLTGDTTTRFSICVFNKIETDHYGDEMKIGFTSDKDALKNFISLYRHDETKFKKPDESDLLLFVKAGLNSLTKEPKDNIRALVVITAGINRTSSGIDISSLINQSLQNKIPIYIIFFSETALETADEVIAPGLLAKGTYGEFIVFEGNVDATRNTLLDAFGKMNDRHYGQDYAINFTSQQKRDNKTHTLLLSVEGTEYPVNYVTPGFSLTIWAKQHLIWFLILLIIIIAIITLGVIFSVKFFRKRRNEIQDKKQGEERQKARELTEQENQKRRVAETQEELRRLKETTEHEKRHVLEQEQIERLTKLMHTKNLHPRLIILNDKNTFNIRNVVTTIGKSEDNDIILSDPTVSRSHAQIIFTDSGFEIHDLQSSNGTIVNDSYVESAELKNKDVIQLGQVAIKFYL